MEINISEVLHITQPQMVWQNIFFKLLRAIKAGMKEKVQLKQCLENFLLTYRTIIHATTKETPCRLMMKRSLRTRLDFLRLNLDSKDLSKQAQQKQYHNNHSS